MTERALLVTGGLGVGKTTVAAEIAGTLDLRGVPYAAVDLDWLCWTGPAGRVPPPAGILGEALAAVWAVYRRHGVRRLVLARALTSPAERAVVAAVLAGVDLDARAASAAVHDTQVDEVPGDPCATARAVLAAAGWDG